MMEDEREPHYMLGNFQGRYNHFCVNGDFHHSSKKVLLNPKHFRDVSHYMDFLTDQLKPTFGAVRKIHTPQCGRRVRSLEDLRAGGVYVVAGVEKFKPFGYTQIESTPRRTAPVNYDVEPGHNRKYNVSGRYRKVETHGKIIKCWPNGNDTKGPKPILLPASHNRCESLDEVLKQVNNAMCEECQGPVEKLYLPNGIKVMSLDQIMPNAHYVALRKNDRFKRAHYKDVSLPNLACSPRLERKMLPPLSRSNKTSSQSSPEHSISSNNGSENSYRQRYRREKAKREEDQVFHARPVKHKRSSEKVRQVDYDQDDGGVFKSKSQNRATKGAKQIDDSRQTRTDLPVDKRPAEEVKDDVKGKDKKDKKGKKEDRDRSPYRDDHDQPPPTYRANARRLESPDNAQAGREAEEKAVRQRQADDRERAEKTRQQQEALRQKRKEKEDRENAKNRRQEAEREKRGRKDDKQRGRANEDEIDEKEKKQRKKRNGTPSPDRNEDQGREKPRDDDQQSLTEMVREQQEQAATTIQAAYRGYRTRKDLKQRQAEREYERARDSAQRLYQDGVGDDWGASPDPFHDYKKEEEERAAITIQSGFRGFKARQQVKAMRAL